MIWGKFNPLQHLLSIVAVAVAASDRSAFCRLREHSERLPPMVHRPPPGTVWQAMDSFRAIRADPDACRSWALISTILKSS